MSFLKAGLKSNIEAAPASYYLLGLTWFTNIQNYFHFYSLYHNHLKKLPLIQGMIYLFHFQFLSFISLTFNIFRHKPGISTFPTQTR